MTSRELPSKQKIISSRHMLSEKNSSSSLDGKFLITRAHATNQTRPEFTEALAGFCGVHPRLRETLYHAVTSLTFQGCSPREHARQMEISYTWDLLEKERAKASRSTSPAKFAISRHDRARRERRRFSLYLHRYCTGSRWRRWGCWRSFALINRFCRCREN